MNKRQTLASTIIFFFMIGLAIAAYPFISSLWPSEKAIAGWPSIDISDLHPGSFKITAYPKAWKFTRDVSYVILVVRKSDGEYKAWPLLARNGVVLIPEYFYWAAYTECKDFGPTMQGDVMDESKPIQCHDDLGTMQSWFASRRWSIDGNALTDQVPDLITVPFKLEGKYLVLKPYY
jgi:hypothetical protein